MIRPSDRITTAEGAAMLGIAASTVRGWIMRELIDHVQIGRDNFVSRRQFQKFKEKPETRPVRQYTRAAVPAETPAAA